MLGKICIRGLTSGEECDTIRVTNLRRRSVMQKFMKSKEARDLVFIAVAIFMAMMICVTSIRSGGLFGIVVSIVLLALLCVGLGYLYCKNEDKVFAAVDKGEKPEKVDKPKKSRVETGFTKIDLEKLELLGLTHSGDDKNGETNKVENGR
jgi:hypothetical protein